MDTSIAPLILVLMLLGSTGKTEAKISTGMIDSDTDFMFVDSFYFSNMGDNVMDYDIKYPADQSSYKLASYDDSVGQWTTLRPNADSLECKYKLDRLDNPDFLITLSREEDICDLETDDDGLEWLRCRGQLDFSSQPQPRWWFIHLTNCRKGGGSVGLRNVTYRLHFTNGELGMLREFPANQNLLLETDLEFLIGYLLMAVIATQYRLKLLKKGRLHVTYRLFYISLLLQTTYIALYFIGLFQYARSGIEKTTIQDTAEMFSCFASIFFVSVLLLVSKGFTITRARISRTGTCKMAFFGIIYAASYTVSFVYRRLILDPRDIIFVNWNMAAAGIVGVKIFGVTMLIYGVFFTVKNHPRKASFYLPFVMYFGVWFAAEPVYMLLSYSYFPIFRSPNVSNGIDLGLSFLGHAYFLYLTRPCYFNKRFPFHLKAPSNPTDMIEDTDSEKHIAVSSVYEVSKDSSTDSTSISMPEDLGDHFETAVTIFHPDSDSDSDFGCDDDDDDHHLKVVGTSVGTSFFSIVSPPPSEDFQVVAPSSSNLTTITTLVDRPKTKKTRTSTATGDDGDTRKKTRREPSYRRFTKTGELIDPITPIPEPRKIKWIKSKKRKLLKKFLKQARRHLQPSPPASLPETEA